MFLKYASFKNIKFPRGNYQTDSSEKKEKTKTKTKRKQTKTLLIQFRLFIFHKAACLQRYFQGTTTIHPGIFHGRALWADSVSPRTNTIASRDQFKPKRIGENLVVNYNQR